MAELVSILIPAFNAERWIASSVQSALAQQWPRKEVIAVDDGSTDATSAILQSLASPVVKVITQDNRGATAARNHALSHAQGDYVQWLDADDLLAPDKIARQMQAAEPGHRSLALLTGPWGRFVAGVGRGPFVPSALWEDLAPAEWLFRKMDQNVWMAIESWLVSRRLTEAAGPWNETLSLDDDGEYFCRVLFASSNVRFVPGASCLCRASKVGMSSDLTLNDRKLDSLAFSLLAHVRTLISLEDSRRTRDSSLKFLNRSAIYFYPERPDLLEQLMTMANQLGAELALPVLRSPYRFLQKLLGFRLAKRVQLVGPPLKSLVIGKAEQFLSSLGSLSRRASVGSESTYESPQEARRRSLHQL